MNARIVAAVFALAALPPARPTPVDERNAVHGPGGATQQGPSRSLPPPRKTRPPGAKKKNRKLGGDAGESQKKAPAA
jgi:hypothetical protein